MKIGIALVSDPYELLVKANLLVSKSITHVQWYRVDPKDYRQLVPVWENYLLHLVGRLSDLEFYQRYHFVDYKKSIKRGIGVCGDTSMILNQILDKYGIENDIIAFNGHVVISATIDDQHYVADPDFGVLMSIPLAELSRRPKQVYDAYLAAGYTENDGVILVDTYSTKYSIFDDVYHFVTKRYIFEYTSYILIWLLPIGLLIVFGLLSQKK